MNLWEIIGRVPSWKARSSNSLWGSMKYHLWTLWYLMTRGMNPVPHLISLIIISSSWPNSSNWTGTQTTQTNSLNRLSCLINSLTITIWAYQHFPHWGPVPNRYFNKMEYSFHTEHFQWWTSLKMDTSIEH